MQNRKFLTIDVEALYQEAVEEASRGRTQEQEVYRQLLQDIKPYYVDWYNKWLQGQKIEPFYPMNSSI